MLDKSWLRKEQLSRRDAIPPEVRKIKSRLIRDRIFALKEFSGAGVVFFFASFRSEVDTFGMIKKSLADGKRVLIPKVIPAKNQLALYEISSLDQLSAGYMGIPEPSGLTDDLIRDIDDIDIVIIPGAAYDESGNRIGYGGGFYDRLLSGLKNEIPVIAPAYEEQIVNYVPTDSHDRKVTIIITDRREIRCN